MISFVFEFEMPPRRRALGQRAEPLPETIDRRSKPIPKIQNASSSCWYFFIPLIFLATFSLFISGGWLFYGIRSSQDWPSWMAIQPQPTLVIYVYSGSDPEYLNNLVFFIKEAVKVGFHLKCLSIYKTFSRQCQKIHRCYALMLLLISSSNLFFPPLISLI